MCVFFNAMHFKDMHLHGNCCMLACQPAGKMLYKKMLRITK